MSTRIVGVGKYVSIAASNSNFPYVSDEDVNGISFGYGSRAYASVATRYILSGTTITGTALCIDNQYSDEFYIDLGNLQVLEINGETGYSGYRTVVTSTSYNSSRQAVMPQTINPWFRNGLLWRW